MMEKETCLRTSKTSILSLEKRKSEAMQAEIVFTNNTFHF